jgi:hypothetical protein
MSGADPEIECGNELDDETQRGRDAEGVERAGCGKGYPLPTGGGVLEGVITLPRKFFNLEIAFFMDF